MKFNEEAFEGTIDIVAAAMEEAEVELSAEGGEKVAEFFEAIYKRLAVIAEEDDDDDDEDDDEEDEEDDEDSEEESEEETEEEEECDAESEEDAVEPAEEEQPAGRTGAFEVYADAQGK